MPEPTAVIESRDLLAMEKTVLEPVHEELIGRSLFPTIPGVNPGSETYGYSVLTRSGAAKIIANGADDLPLVDEDIHRAFQPIYTIADGIHFTYQEVRAAQMAGQPLDTIKAATARRAIAEKENDIIFNGEKSVNIKGLTSIEGIQAISADKTFATSTGAEMQETLRKAKALITKLPGYTGARLKLVLPPDEFESLNSRYSDYDARTVLKVVQDAGWFQSIETTTALAGKGDKDTDCAMIFDSTANTAGFLLPMDITQYPQENRYPKIVVPFDERTGGLVIKTPYAIVKLSGI
ncbi:DUF2184 domain-containing protein [Lactiplantibacillus plantarum]|uniref:DUF2184 domain-containing protein n=1 Tax=Lactiplantibacillus plantarum TaxID=1590 RepID=UPI003F53830A